MEEKCDAYTQWKATPLQQKKILTHAKTWMNLADVRLRETDQPQKDGF
jgi:hypothetical protein